MSETVQVACYAGSHYPERPRAVHYQGRWLDIETIESRWRQPEGVGFRVRAMDGQKFVLFYDLQHECWQLKEI